MLWIGSQYSNERFSFSLLFGKRWSVMHVLVLIFLLCLSNLSKIDADIHGGSVLAVAGLDSIVLVSDTRYTAPSTNRVALGNYNRKCFRVGVSSVVFCFGLDSDAYSLFTAIKRHLTDYESNDITPQSVSKIVSNIMYEKQFYLTPVVVGLTETDPYLSIMDGLGALTETSSYVAAGSSSSGLHAFCEAYYKLKLPKEQLIEFADQCFRSSLVRDAVSGGTTNFLIIDRDGIHLKAKD